MVNTIFFIGDIVILKTGGVKMTVSQVNMVKPEVTCIWFSNGKCEMQVFNVTLLESASHSQLKKLQTEKTAN